MIIYLSCTDYNGTTLLYAHSSLHNPLVICHFWYLPFLLPWSPSSNSPTACVSSSNTNMMPTKTRLSRVDSCNWFFNLSIASAFLSKQRMPLPFPRHHPPSCDVLSLYYPHFLSFNYSSFSSLSMYDFPPKHIKNSSCSCGVYFSAHSIDPHRSQLRWDHVCHSPSSLSP